MDRMTAPRAVIVGGGFAGLTASHYLRKAGWDVVLLEASNAVGGRVQTVRKQGYVLDTGATQMSSGYGEYLALCKELGLIDQMIESHRLVGVLRHGRIHVIDSGSVISGPLSPVLTWRGKLTLMKAIGQYLAVRPPIDVLDVPSSHSLDTESAAEYASRCLSQEMFDVLVDPLVRTYVMNRGRNVSALEWFSALRNLGGQKMLSLSGGNDVLPRALARDAKVLLGAAATSVRKTGEQMQVAYRDRSGAQHEITADACVLATRLPEAIALYAPVRDWAGRLNETLRYNRAWVVQVGYRVRPTCNVVGVLLPSAESPAVGLLWCEHNKNPDRVPAGHSLFSVYSDEAANDENLPKSDADLIQLGQEFVERLFPELRGHRDLAHITRWPMAIPNPAPGVYRDLHEMKQRLDPADRVQLAGDYFTCTGQNSAIYYGKRAALNLIHHHAHAARGTQLNEALHD